MRVNLYAELLEKSPADGADGHASSRLPRRSPFEDIAHVIEPVFHCSGKVRVSRTETRYALGFAFVGLHLHHLAPVLPHAVLDEHGDRASQRLAVTDAPDDLGVILLDLLAPRATVSTLPATQVSSDVLFGNLQARRNSVKRDHKRLSVRLARREETQFAHDAAPASEGSSSSTKAGGATSIGSGCPRSPMRYLPPR